MTDKRYEWRNYSPKGVSADDAGKVLEKVHSRDGSIKPQAVVDEARPEDSPIHPVFEWRNEIAAEEHRKWQARQLVRNVRVVTVSESGEKETAPAYVHVRATSEKAKDGGYHAAAKVVSDLDLFDRAINEAHHKLCSAERAVEELNALAKKTNQRDKLAAIGIIAASLQAAAKALNTMH
jgi:hypothetical protein